MSTAIAPVSLYQLTEDLAAIEDELLESGGEITEEMERSYEELLQMHAEKVEGYLALIRKFEATAVALKDEIDRLQAARKTMDNAAANLKNRLRDAMRRRGETEHQTRLGKVKVQRSSSVPVVLKVTPEQLPEWFRRVKVEADLVALRNALKEGDAGDYAELGEASYYLRIY